MWRLRLRAALCAKAPWCLFRETLSETVGSAESSSPTDPKILKRTFHIEKGCGMIIAKLENSPLRVVIDAEDDSFQMLMLLDSRYASNRTVPRIAIQSKLFRMCYMGQNMSSYID